MAHPEALSYWMQCAAVTTTLPCRPARLGYPAAVSDALSIRQAPQRQSWHLHVWEWAQVGVGGSGRKSDNTTAGSQAQAVLSQHSVLTGMCTVGLL